MPDIEKSEFVEVPGFEEEKLIDALLPFVKKPDLPKRIIKLPMELRMTNWVANGYIYGLIGSLFLLSVSIYVLIDSANRIGDLSCRGKGGKIVHGDSCRYPFYFFSLLSGVMGLGSYLGYRKAADVYQRAARITGPHLRLTRDAFWCHELIEPIRFEDVIESQVFDSGAHGRVRMQHVDFILRRPPILAYGEAKKTVTWRGEFPLFQFSALPFPKNDGLVHIIGFLVEEYKKDHPDPRLVKL